MGIFENPLLMMCEIGYILWNEVVYSLSLDGPIWICRERKLFWVFHWSVSSRGWKFGFIIATLR